jgi:hypothetical protein
MVNTPDKPDKPKDALQHQLDDIFAALGALLTSRYNTGALNDLRNSLMALRASLATQGALPNP